MANPARARWVDILVAALLGGALAGCGGSTPMDMYFGTDVGADFRAPVTDAGANGDTNVTPEPDAAGTGGATATGGTTGTGGATGTGGTTGTGGATGTGGGTGTGGTGMDGAAGAAGSGA